MAAVANQRELRVIGVSRSGNHCIINWIMGQIDGRACFLNCAEGKTNPFRTARPLETGRPFRVNYPDFDLHAERRGAFSPKDWLLHSYEDSFLGYVCGEPFEANHDRFVGASARRFDVLVLRDPFNLFASRRRLWADERVAVVARVWRQHAREFLGVRRYLNQNRVLVNYNAWVTSRDYRRTLAERLRLTFSDAGVDAVARCGGGSSFDGVRFDGRARRMPVFERWRAFAADPRYRAIFDPETVDLTRRIFGEIPGTEQWLASRAAA